MRPDLILLCFAYVLSQFFRAFLAVLTQALKSDLGTTPEDLAFASGLWFVSFAAMQIPVGWALDKFGPRRTASILLFIGGGGGAALFALAQSATQINLAMLLIGVGCSPVLMSSYYIFAMSYPPARFATLAALMLGMGSAGNLAAAYPMAWASEMIGWRASLWALALFSGLTAIGLFAIVKDPEKPDQTPKGSVLDLLKIRALWLLFPIMFVNYVPVAAIRGLWIGPYLSDVFAMSTTGVGQATLFLGAAMIAGTLAYGPLDRVFNTRKWVITGGTAITAIGCLALAWWPGQSALLAVTLMCVIGFFGATFPMIIAHGRSFFPDHLAGRGVTLMNLFGIGGVGLIQAQTGTLFTAYATPDPVNGYQALFLFFGLLLFAGMLAYLFSEDRTG